ncbi:hypothetical protein [Anaerovibrio sp. RM50]|uniref:hypothetical protein n=1 Tax=Anaerovibrio sp. RM50 TaxID=1200557 RepID=UPI0004884159|nr:hypothetical protein [Anaerovibrio sp. RM50]
MKKLFDWYITRHPTNVYAIEELEGVEYLGQEDYFYIAHGRMLDKSEPSGSAKWRTSVIRKLEFVEESNSLHIHTLNSIYVCSVDECKIKKQAPFDVLPEPVRGKVEAECRAHINAPREANKNLLHAPEEPNTILLAFNENDNNLNFVDGAYNRDGHTAHLTPFPHLGMFMDSVLIYDESLGRSEIDIRYFPTANPGQGAIEFYSFDTDGFSVYLYNVGEAPLIFKTPVGTIELAPGEKKLVSEENASPKDEEKLLAQKDELLKELPKLMGESEVKKT